MSPDEKLSLEQDIPTLEGNHRKCLNSSITRRNKKENTIEDGVKHYDIIYNMSLTMSKYVKTKHPGKKINESLNELDADQFSQAERQMISI